MKRLEESIQCYQKGLEIDPNNVQLKEGLKEVSDQHSASTFRLPRNPFTSENAIAKLALDPRTRGFLSDPEFMKLLESCQNPESFVRFV